MNYQNIYDSIIQKARSKSRVKGKDVYFESHHIVPVCLGGSNDSSNKVLLTAREHFVCHKLLVEIYPNNEKLVHALWMMIYMKNGNRNYKISSIEYEKVKIEHSILVCKIMEGRFVSDETKLKMRESHIGQFHSIDSKNKRSKKLKGVKQSKEFIEKRRLAMIGRKMPDGFGEKVSIRMKGKSPWNKGLKMSIEFCIKNSEAQKKRIKKQFIYD